MGSFLCCFDRGTDSISYHERDEVEKPRRSSKGKQMLEREDALDIAPSCIKETGFSRKTQYSLLVVVVGVLCVSCQLTTYWSICVLCLNVVFFLACLRYCFIKQNAQTNGVSLSRRSSRQFRTPSQDSPVDHPALRAFEVQWAMLLDDLPANPKRMKSDGLLINWNVEGSESFVAEMRRIAKGDMIRFLIARDGDVSRSLHLAKTVVLWRAAVQPASVSLTMIPNAIPMELWRFAGWSKCGYPIFAANVDKWEPAKYYATDEYVRYVAYVLETVVTARMGDGVSKFIIIGDLGKWHSGCIRPVAMRIVMALGTILQEQNAERVAAAFVVNTSWFFSSSWHLIEPFVDPRSARKVHWLSAERVNPVLSMFIDKAVLEKEYGGDHDPYPAYFGNWEQDTAGPPPPSYDASAPDPLYWNRTT